MTYGSHLKNLIDGSGVSKTAICSALGISRPYLYSVFYSRAAPPVPDKQMVIADILDLSEKETTKLCDMAAQERGDTPADIAHLVKDVDVRERIRDEHVYSALDDERGAYAAKTATDAVKTSPRLRVPCCYQGGKQRVAGEIVDTIFASDARIGSKTKFLDVCCGSGAFTIELINRGVPPDDITMIDIGSWGVFWKSVCTGSFDMEKFSHMLDKIPSDKRRIQQYMTDLANSDIGDNECYLYPILQACSFGGKQIWREGNKWMNAFFRSYWMPTATSKRRSPANPMQPSPVTLRKRVAALVSECPGITCYHADVNVIFSLGIPGNAVIYVDPPYEGATGYADDFDTYAFIEKCRQQIHVPVFVSEKRPLSEDARKLDSQGPKGGISGNRRSRHDEWLSKVV